MKSWFFVSDLHASLNLPHAKLNSDGTSSDRLVDVIDVIDDIAHAAKKEKPHGVFILGDLFHSRHPDAPTLKAVSRALRELADVCMVYILPGNHDAHGKNSDVYSLSMFNELRIPGIMVFDSPEIFTEDDVDFVIMPWVPDNKFAEKLADFTKGALLASRKKVLLMHQTIAGSSANGRKMSGISPREFAKDFDLVLSGHIHEPQRIGPKVQYLGSPLPLSFGEADGVDRGWYRMNKELDLDLVKIDSSPDFVKWVFEQKPDLVKNYESVISALISDLEDSLLTREIYLDVRVHGPRKHVDFVVNAVQGELDMLRDRLRFTKISRIVTDDGSDRVRETAGGNSMTPQELVRLYSEANASLLPDGTNLEDILALGQKLLGEAS